MSLGMYALAMQGAQFLEYKLAILCVWVQSDFTPRQAPKNLEKALRPIIRRVEHAFQNASGSELRNRLRGEITTELLEEINRLLLVRNGLAHRYLRDQYVLPPPVFGQRMFDEMQSLISEFDAVNTRIDGEIERVIRAKGGGDDDDTIPGVEALAKRLMYGDLE